MPKFNKTIQVAIEKAVTKLGSQAALCKRTGISTSIMSRYLKGEVENINLGTWNLLIPEIAEFLPEHYCFAFPPTAPQVLEEQKNKNPDLFNALMQTDSYREKMDLDDAFKEAPLSLSSPKKKNIINAIVDKLPYLTEVELDNILFDIYQLQKRSK